MEQILQTLLQQIERQERIIEAVAQTQNMQVQALQAANERAARTQEVKVEGLTMPKYHGRMDESISLYIHQVNTFFKAKNLNPQQDPATQERCIALIEDRPKH
ncbi:hypothetical protein H310_09730 [Aphanomyces invadans]|uniref:Uncharacterized protein n=1 Tax=Aphanomyces invadans TaxID=157072 RepID=A0A024TUX2_9STRA|nr:hypothetical protein H310_09730 [Aphanomyces invadans]ETV97396.1 hypothetical protein H310_09730 [Aphanomyces invadans]|eukprot:XP_008874104.1 hypothetical protein H310_09730 [Aphanomyces invadans]